MEFIENLVFSHGRALGAVIVTDESKPNNPREIQLDNLKVSKKMKLKIDMKMENLIHIESNQDTLVIQGHDTNVSGLPGLRVPEITPTADSNAKHELLRSSRMDIREEGGCDPLVLSLCRPVGCFSYFGSGAYCAVDYDMKAPPPIYMTAPLPNKRFSTPEALFHGLLITSGGELKVVDKQVLAKFKGLMSEMMKKIASAISSGGGMVGVSMPIRIFEPRSALERISDLWGYAVNFLSKGLHLGAQLSQKERVENIGSAMAFGVAGMSLSLSMYKPFNPLLGETYQGVYPDGTTLSVEHISHHPPVSVFWMDHP